eukprot:jgi/Galph1/3056/GphlegSOOS_G1733.1
MNTQSPRDDPFSLSGFLSTPKYYVEDWVDPFVRSEGDETVKDTFQRLFSPSCGGPMEKFRRDYFLDSPSSTFQIVPEWLPGEDRCFAQASPNHSVVVSEHSRKSSDTSSNTSISKRKETEKPRCTQVRERSYEQSIYYQRPLLSNVADTNSRKPRTSAEEKEYLMKEFKKKLREAAVVRFRQKRRERNFANVVRYNCRKKVADARPRYKGRFIKIQNDKNEGEKLQKSTQNREFDDDVQVVPSLCQ